MNIQGLISKSVNKLEWPEIQQLFKNNDILMFTETWGNSFTNFDVENFQHLELNRNEYKPNSKRSSGGVIIYIKNSIIKQGSNISVVKQNDDVIWLMLDKKIPSCRLYCIYAYVIMFPRAQVDRI